MKKKKSIILFALVLVIVLTLTNCDLFLQKDDIKPSVTITYPQYEQEVNGIIQITASADDNVGIYKVVFYINGVFLGEVYEAPYTINWDTSSSTLGNINITATAFDTSGNSATSSPVRVFHVAADTSGSEGIVFFEDFEAYSYEEILIGHTLSTAWIAGGFGNTKLSITEDPILSGQGKTLHINDPGGSNDNTLANATYSSVDTGTFSFDILFAENSDIAFLIGTQVGGDLLSAFMIAFEEHDDEIVLTYSHDEKTYKSSVTLSKNTWHTISGTFNSKSNTYSVIVNGTGAVSNIIYDDHSVNVINTLSFMTYRAIGMSANVYIDNVTIASALEDGGPDAPDVPKNLSATQGTYTDKITLSWDASESADYYNIYRSDSLDGEYVLIGWVEGEYTIVSNSTTSPPGYEIVPGNKYFYKIDAEIYDAATNTYINSDLSAVAEGWADIGIIAPEDFTITYEYKRIVEGEPSNLSGYYVTIGPGETGSVVDLTDNKSSLITVSQSDLDHLYEITLDTQMYRADWTPPESDDPKGVITTYTFTITANGETITEINRYSGNTEEQEDLDIMLSAIKELAALPAPSGVTAIWNTSIDQIEVAWEPVIGGVNYRVYWSYQSDGTYTEANGTRIGNKLFLSNIDLTKTYYFKVAAVDEEEHKGALSSYRSVTPIGTIAFEPDETSYWYRYFTNDDTNKDNTFWQTSLFETLNFGESITFEIKKESGTTNGAFGLIFRFSDVNNFHYVIINTSGQFYIGRIENGDFKMEQWWTSNEYINTGIGAVNTISINYQQGGLGATIYEYLIRFNNSFGHRLTYNYQDYNRGYGPVWQVMPTENFPTNPVDLYFRQTHPVTKP